MSIKGWPTQEKDDRLSPQYATVEPVRQLQNALSVLAHEFVREVGTDSVEANSTTILINATGHAAQVGDVIRLTSGTLSGQEVKVYSVAANSITLAEELASAPALGVTFQILRHKYPMVNSSGSLITTATELATAADGGALPAEVKVVGGYDGSAVQVIKTDANGELQVDVLSSALPTGASTSANQTNGSQKSQVVNSTGTSVDAKTLGTQVVSTDVGLIVNAAIHGLSSAGGGTYVDMKVTPSGAVLTALGDITGVVGQNTMANSLPVTIASNQSAVPASQSGTWNITNVSGTVSLPTGAATASNQTTIGSQTTKINDGTNTAAVKGASTAAIATDPALVVAISPNNTVAATQSGTWNINNVSGTVSLPTGAATSANQTTLGSQTTKINDGTNTAAVKASSTAAVVTDPSLVVAISPNSKAVDATQAGTWNINNISGTVSLPTGAATSARQDTGNTSLSSIDGKFGSLGQKAMTGSAPVVIASDQSTLNITQAGRSVRNRARIDYTSTSVTTAAYTQLLASTSGAVNEVEIFDSSGQTLLLATGAAASETDQVYIFPGGNGRIPLAIATSTRVSIKAVSATANSGEISVNFYS